MMIIYELIPNLFYSNLGLISRILSIFTILLTPFIIYNVYSLTMKYFTYKKKKPPLKKYIIFDGLIGAGKTTLIKMLVKTMKSKGYKVKPIFEPIDVWEDSGALKLFYEDIKTHCYEFQTFTYITRIQKLLKEIDLTDDIEYYLIERSIFTDKYIFVEMPKEQMGETRMEMYNIWWNMWKKLIPFKPSLFVMLDTSVDDSQDRLKIRNRAGEIVSKEGRHEVKHSIPTYQKSIDILGFEHKTPLYDGLTKMWEWAQKQPKRDRFVWPSYELDKGIYSFWKK